MWNTLREQDRVPGCANMGVIGLSSLRSKNEHAKLIFDCEGSGVTSVSIQELQAILNKELEKDWRNRSRAVILNPELEAWGGVNHRMLTTFQIE